MSVRRQTGYRGLASPARSPGSDFDTEKEVVRMARGAVAEPAPQHPIRSMQGPFEESIAESENPEAGQPPSHSKRSAKERHQRLLEGKGSNATYNARWRRKQPKAKYHPLSKVIAQIAFGVHLLQQQLAKSDEEVVRILQRHVDEIDTFIQRAGEDLDAALADIQERINYLELPLKHADVFDNMLEDRQFRLQIVTGNELIEGVISRSAELLNDSLVDINKGKECTKAMSKYLHDVEVDWPEDELDDSLAIYRTMQANTEGWLECLQGLQLKANRLGASLVQLTNVLNEMQTRAGVASRRSIAVSRANSRAGSRAGSAMGPRPGSSSSSKARYSVTGGKTPTSRYARGAFPKPLPEDPVGRQHPLPLQRLKLQSIPDRWEPRPRDKSPRGESIRREFPAATNIPVELPSPTTTRPPVDRMERSPLLVPLEVFPANARQPQKKSSFNSLKTSFRVFEGNSAKETQKDSSPRIGLLRSRSRSKKKSLPDLKEQNTSMPDSAYSSGSSELDNHQRSTAVNPTARLPSPQAADKLPDTRGHSRGKSRLGGHRSSKDTRNRSDISLPLHGRSVRVDSQVQYMPRRESAPAGSSRAPRRKPSFGRIKRWFSTKSTRESAAGSGDDGSAATTPTKHSKEKKKEKEKEKRKKRADLAHGGIPQGLL